LITELEIAHEELVQWVGLIYQLEVQSLTFLPLGECSWCYQLTDSSGQTYLLKVARAGNCETPPMNDQTIRTLQALYYEFGINQMTPPPLRGATGQYVNALKSHTAVLLKYIEGTPANQVGLNEAQQRQLGALLARIHRSKLHLRERPMAETFGEGLLPNLRRILGEAATPTRHYAPFHLRFLGILNAVRPRLELQLGEFARLQQALSEDVGLHADFVVCHGDPSAGNILLTPDENLVLIDWDAPLFAPRERDLVYVMDQPLVMEAYQKIVGEVLLRPEIVRFYQLLWDLGAIADFGRRILFRRQSKAQNKHDVLALIQHLKQLGWLA
jgi:spectinomycin phosphotransferase